MNKTRFKWDSLFERVHATATGHSYGPVASKTFRRVVINRVRLCHVPYSTKNGWSYQWDGELINTGTPRIFEGMKYKQRPSDILHDLAHWAVCTSFKRRGLPDFGLGDGGTSKMSASVVSLEKCRKEEEHAGLLTVLMEFELGMRAGDSLNDYLHDSLDISYQLNYDDADAGAEIDSCMEWLLRRGLISERGKVRWRGVSRGCAG